MHAEGILEEWYEVQLAKIQLLVDQQIIAPPAVFNQPSPLDNSRLNFASTAHMHDLIANLHHLMEETQEALECLPLRRNYKVDSNVVLTEERVKDLKKELIDIGCFWLNAFIMIGCTVEDIDNVVYEVLKNNKTRQDHVGNN